MDKSELQIGDWVYNTHNRQNEQVAEIGSGLVMLAYNDLYEYDEIEPIPLTSEILYENLRELPEVIRWFWDDKKSTDDEMWFIIHTNSLDHITLDASIRYVHELQHALRLCGIEKEIIIKN